MARSTSGLHPRLRLGFAVSFPLPLHPHAVLVCMYVQDPTPTLSVSSFRLESWTNSACQWHQTRQDRAWHILADIRQPMAPKAGCSFGRKRSANGFTTHRQARTRTKTAAKLTPTGRKIVPIPTLPPLTPSSDTICTMIRPTISSSIAAVVRTVPSLVVTRLQVLRTAKVVPRLVEQRAAPAANA